MGAAAPLLVGGILGLGAAGLSYMGQKNMYKNMNNSQNAALMDMQDNNASLLEQLPEPPEAPAQDAAEDNSAAEAARQKEMQAAALAEQQNMTNPTGGLGVAGGATTNRKELLGS